MKYQSSNTKQIYDIEFTDKMNKCPECADNRKKKNIKNVQYYPETDTAYCFHCEATFFKFNPYKKEKEYVLPEWQNKTELTDKSVKFFESRMIKQDVLNELKIYSDISFMPQFNKEVEVICFPYFIDEKLINIKYRGAKKSFKLHSGSELIFYNFNALKNGNNIIICEGEMDLLTWYCSGNKNVISVPNGASSNKMEYLDSCIKYFDSIEKVYISSDNDTKGIELRDELIRRIGIEKCYIINLKECKDANEYALKYGLVELSDTIKTAKQKTIDGIVTAESMYNDLRNYFEQGDKSGLKTGIKEIDKYITWETSRLAVTTGIPGSGKSEFIDLINVKLNLLHGWKAAYFTPENFPLKYHYEKIFEKLIGNKFNSKESNDIEFDVAFDYINENFFYILPEENTGLDYILDRAKFIIKTKGIKILVIDPYNKVDHQYQSNQSETQYISRFLDKLTHFCKLYDILIILIAHPRKMEKGQIPSAYDISGSANFYNKPDYVFTTHREFDENNLMTNDVQVHWQKIKYKNLGEQGVSEFRYNYKNGRFEDKNKSIDYWDKSNWLNIGQNEIETNNDIEQNTDFSNFNEEPPF